MKKASKLIEKLAVKISLVFFAATFVLAIFNQPAWAIFTGTMTVICFVGALKEELLGELEEVIEEKMSNNEPPKPPNL